MELLREFEDPSVNFLVQSRSCWGLQDQPEKHTPALRQLGGLNQSKTGRNMSINLFQIESHLPLQKCIYTSSPVLLNLQRPTSVSSLVARCSVDEPSQEQEL